MCEGQGSSCSVCLPVISVCACGSVTILAATYYLVYKCTLSIRWCYALYGIFESSANIC